MFKNEQFHVFYLHQFLRLKKEKMRRVREGKETGRVHISQSAEPKIKLEHQADLPQEG